MNHPILSFIDYLSTKYPPTLSIRHVSEITNETEQTIRNGVSKGNYPIPSFKIGKKRLFRLIDVATFIDGQFQGSVKTLSSKTSPGRPTKAQQIAKRSIEKAHS